MNEPRARVLYVTPALPPAQIPEADHSLRDCLELAARGVDVHVLTVRAWQGTQPREGVTVHAIMERWAWSEAPRVWRLLRNLKPDAVFIYFLGSLYGYRSLPTMIPILASLSSPRARTIVRFSNFGRGGAPGGSLAGRLRFAVMRILGPLRYGSLLIVSRNIVVVGDWMMEALRAISARAAAKATVIPPPPLMVVNRDREAGRKRGRARLGIAQHEILVAFFGRLYPGKGIEAFLDSGPEILAAHGDVRFGLIGGYYQPDVTWVARPSYAADLESRIHQLGLDTAVVQSGEYAFDGGEASDLISAIDIAVLPLPGGIRTNNSSFAALCAHGVAVIGTASAPTESSIRDGENTLLMSDADPHSIAQAVRMLVEDPHLRQRIEAGAKALARERFDWQRATSRLLDLMDIHVSNPIPERARSWREEGAIVKTPSED
jgi:glycosyltransferase involved in cell wall biosynthesis